MNYVIRHGTIEDAVLIADISHQSFYETFAADNTKEDMDKFLTQQFTKGKLMLEVGRPENIFLLAYVENEIAGYAKLREGKSPVELKETNTIELARIYVLNKMIGKGVGKILMEHCIEIAKEKSRKILWLGVWEKNKRAIEFYIKFGFEKFGDTEFLLGDDLQRDWLMKRFI